jgi:hypothetical protein
VALRAFASGLDGPSGVLLCSVLFVVALAITVAGRVAQIEALSLGGVFGVVVFGVGAAPLQLLSRLDIYARLTGATVVGLSVVLAVGALMADVRSLWHPTPAAVAVGMAAVVLHGLGLSRVQTPRRHQVPADDADAEASADAEDGAAVENAAAATETRGGSKLLPLSLLLTLVGTVMWLVPALTTHDPQPGIWGFLTDISAVWYVGLAMVVVGFALGRRGELSALTATLSFGVASTLTPALVYATPRNSTAAKQMLITQYVLVHHHIDAPGGIYQAFSALFSGMAWLCQLIHVHGMLGDGSLLGLGTYWPVIFVFARIVELRFFAGRLLETPGQRWTAVMLVLLVDTINDANYFSPQSAAYVMAIGVFAFAVKGVNRRPLGRRATFWLLLLVGVALAPTHEITPYIAAGALFVLAVFGQAPAWSCLPIGLPALAWAAVVHKAIGSNFSFTELFNFSNLLPPPTASTSGLTRLAAVGYQSHALLLALLILIGLAAVGFFTNIRTKWAWGYGLCPAVGIALILINPYGNEGIFRSSLFAIPWLAVLAMHMRLSARMLSVLTRPLVLSTGLTAGLLVLLATFVVAEWGVDGAYYLLRSDLAVQDYLGSRPSENAFVMTLGASGNAGVGYSSFLVNYKTVGWDSVVTQGLRDVRVPRAPDLVALTDLYGAVAVGEGASNSSPLYIFWSPAQALQSEAYAVQSAVQMNAWLALLKRSSSWRVADHNGDSFLFELRRG